MKTILEEHHLTGWTTYPVIVYDKKGNVIPNYHGFSVIGRCDPIDYTKSHVIYKQCTPNGPLYKHYKGIHVDNWDGNHFFSPIDSLWLFVTEKVATIIKQYKITNVELKNLDDIERDAT